MTRRLKRTRNFELSLDIRSEDFVRPPRESQRNWLLNRALKELSDDLEHLHQIAPDFVPGIDATGDLAGRESRDLADDQIMEDWQDPIMKRMAAFVTEAQGDVLEIGFGRGIGASYIQNGDPRSHTIIECNASVIARYQHWLQQYNGKSIQLVPGLWQDVIQSLGQFDSIFFHTYPLNQTDVIEKVVQSATFAEHFFPVAAEHLCDGGVFTYLTNEIDSLSRAHQRALFGHFSRFESSLIEGLEIPHDTSDAMWSDSMVLIKAYK
ncbi:MAG: class I SAM-dependent methyltransferase [Burkholderiaceae bacterium]